MGIRDFEDDLKQNDSKKKTVRKMIVKLTYAWPCIDDLQMQIFPHTNSPDSFHLTPTLLHFNFFFLRIL